MPNKPESREGVSAEHQWVCSRLESVRSKGLWRELRRVDDGQIYAEAGGQQVINFSGNDYLGLRHNPQLLAACAEAVNESGVGSGASRLLSGTKRQHLECEAELEEWSASPALVLGSGYLANLALLSTFADRSSVILLDRLAHASLLDGAQLSRAKMMRFQHNDVNSLEDMLRKVRESDSAKRVLVVTESIFSMDGDIAPLREMSQLCARYDAQLVVDEAHAVGVFGDKGTGLCSEMGISELVPYRTATFSKSLASYGGFVLARREACDLLVNSARQFIYDTALPPHIVSTAAYAVRMLADSPELGSTLLEKSAFFRNALHSAGVPAGGDAHIVPLILGSSETALKFADALLSRGVLAVAIRPPTVPEGTARVRFSLSLTHSEQQLRDAVQVVREVVEHTGIQPLERP